jgi:hypothetical protein
MTLSSEVSRQPAASKEGSGVGADGSVAIISWLAPAA